MRTLKITLVLGVMFVVAMAAGVMAGRATARPGSRPSAPPPESTQEVGGSPLADELQLSREQAEQMRPIWEAARTTAQASAKEAERIQREHDEQLRAMLTDEQRARYAQLSQANHRRIAAADARRREAFRQAVAETKKILRPDQWRAYEQIIRNQVGAAPDLGEEAPPTATK
jgi:Spy/CpxP family protein refolding chaperone